MTSLLPRWGISCVTRKQASTSLLRPLAQRPSFRISRMSTMQNIQDMAQSAVDTLSGKPGYQQTDVPDLHGKVWIISLQRPAVADLRRW
jgi:phage terminase large subunit-like protein